MLTSEQGSLTLDLGLKSLETGPVILDLVTEPMSYIFIMSKHSQKGFS
jgi:hypothetical protein